MDVNLEEYPEGISMNDVNEDAEDMDEDEQMDEPIEMDAIDQDAQPDGEAMEGADGDEAAEV